MRHGKVIALLGGALAAGALPVQGLPAQVLEEPFRIEADGRPIEVDIGHAAPFVHDLDGDGVRDLIVGQFGQGRCRIYQNLGSDREPRFGAFTWLEGGGEIASVAAG